jgi:hypothetical protein
MLLLVFKQNPAHLRRYLRTPAVQGHVSIVPSFNENRYLGAASERTSPGTLRGFSVSLRPTESKSAFQNTIILSV